MIDADMELQDVAEMFMNKHFPNASIIEKNRMILDWVNKLSNTEQTVDDFKKRVFDPKNTSILDCGSGSGGFGISFTKAGTKVNGIEIEPDLIEVSEYRKKIAQLTDSPVFTLYDGKHFPFNDDEFDAALSVSVLEHVTNPALYLSEIYRTLKPGGMLYFAMPNGLWPKETHTQLWGITYLPTWLTKIIIKQTGRSSLESYNLHFYHWWSLKRLIAQSSKHWIIVPERGHTRNSFLKLVKRILLFVKIPHQALLPHIMLVLKKPEL